MARCRDERIELPTSGRIDRIIRSALSRGEDLLFANRRDEQEMSVLCLRILQAALVYVNTLMLQDIFADPDWEGWCGARAGNNG